MEIPSSAIHRSKAELIIILLGLSDTPIKLPKKGYKIMEKEYIDLYQQHHLTIKKHSSDVLNIKRDQAFEKFMNLGFPTKNLERYRYSDFTQVLSIDYGLNINRLPIPVDPYKIFKCDVPGIQSYLFFMLNDSFYPVVDHRYRNLPEGVIIGSLKDVATSNPRLVEPYLGLLSGKANDGLVSFNEAFSQDGFFMYIPDNVQLDKPVQLVNILRSDVDLMAVNRNLIILGKNAKAQLLVCDHTEDNVQFLANRLTEVFVSENAQYEHYNLENTHTKTSKMASLFITQNNDSTVLVNDIALHNGVTRNNIDIHLDGENCQTQLCGMAIGDKNQYVDNSTAIYHNRPNSHSRELYKYVMDDESKGLFEGKLYVAKDAQKTEAYQTNRNILLSKTAKVRTKPQLEIYADDVKCSHGATIGQLDESALFYMRQRGISYAEARLLLMFAFTNDVIEQIKIPALQDRIKMLVEKRLRGDLSKCEGCVICG